MSKIKVNQILAPTPNSTKAELSSPSRGIEDGDILSSSCSPSKRAEFELLFHEATSSRRVLDKSELMKAVRIRFNADGLNNGKNPALNAEVH